MDTLTQPFPVQVQSRPKWKPTHRLVAVLGETRAVHCCLIHLTPDGEGYTRYEWMNEMPPSFKRLSQEQWLYCNTETRHRELCTPTLTPLDEPSRHMK